MNLYDVLSITYPNANFLDDIQLGDHGDGNGQVIVKWNLQGIPQPSAADIAAMMTNPAIISAYTFKQNLISNELILAQLDDIDRKSIRAIRENDTTRMAQYEQQAVALRTQLLPIK
jgi:hypothetical protein